MLTNLAPNCIKSIEECLGGPYRTKELRATCKYIRSATRPAPFQTPTLYKFCKYCCREGDWCALDSALRHYQTLPFAGILEWIAKYHRSEMFTRLFQRFEITDYNYMVIGAARSGDLTQYRLVLDIFRKTSPRHFNMGLHLWSLEFNAGRSGSMKMCGEIRKFTNSFYLQPYLCGAAAGGHVDLCETLISRGANNFSDMVHYAAKKDSVEIFELSSKYLGFEQCSQLLFKYPPRDKLWKHVQEKSLILHQNTIL